MDSRSFSTESDCSKLEKFLPTHSEPLVPSSLLALYVAVPVLFLPGSSTDLFSWLLLVPESSDSFRSEFQRSEQWIRDPIVPSPTVPI